jgi:hypothetical protein
VKTKAPPWYIAGTINYTWVSVGDVTKLEIPKSILLHYDLITTNSVFSNPVPVRVRVSPALGF